MSSVKGTIHIGMKAIPATNSLNTWCHLLMSTNVNHRWGLHVLTVFASCKSMIKSMLILMSTNVNRRWRFRSDRSSRTSKMKSMIVWCQSGVNQCSSTSIYDDHNTPRNWSDFESPNVYHVINPYQTAPDRHFSFKDHSHNMTRVKTRWFGKFRCIWDVGKVTSLTISSWSWCQTLR